MSKMIQIRNVPDEIHRALKVRAAREGMTLSGYLLREVSRLAERPTLEELIERAKRRKPLKPIRHHTAKIPRPVRYMGVGKDGPPVMAGIGLVEGTPT